MPATFRASRWGTPWTITPRRHGAKHVAPHRAAHPPSTAGTSSVRVLNAARELVAHGDMNTPADLTAVAARSGVRVAHFANQFPTTAALRAAVATVCAADLEDAMQSSDWNAAVDLDGLIDICADVWVRQLVTDAAFATLVADDDPVLQAGVAATAGPIADLALSTRQQRGDCVGWLVERFTAALVSMPATAGELLRKRLSRSELHAALRTSLQLALRR